MNMKEATGIVDFLRQCAADDHTALTEKLSSYRTYLIGKLMGYEIVEAPHNIDTVVLHQAALRIGEMTTRVPKELRREIELELATIIKLTK